MSVVGLDEGGDITVNLVGSRPSKRQSAFEPRRAGDINSGGQAMPVDFEARLVGDMVYFNLGDGNGWMGARAGRHDERPGQFLRSRRRPAGRSRGAGRGRPEWTDGQ
ncbi:MAG: hypothetical protein IPK19_25185 [Chloroflexi bacterium]|nr:hypothetical protein [Chloroflexota bacterium]